MVIGFGSTSAGDRAIGTAVAAARQAGVRAIIQDGGSTELPSDDLLRIGDVPHDWLFPQAAAVVHHAGAGTTAAALRAGIPAVTVPAHVDQPFWAARVAALGAGPPPIPFARLTADRLATAITAAVTSAEHLRSAREISAQLASEDGATGILAELERLR